MRSRTKKNMRKEELRARLTKGSQTQSTHAQPPHIMDQRFPHENEKHSWCVCPIVVCSNVRWTDKEPTFI